eukprot:467007_1
MSLASSKVDRTDEILSPTANTHLDIEIKEDSDVLKSDSLESTNDDVLSPMDEGFTFSDSTWFSPFRALVLFTTLSFFTYFDRGAFSAAQTDIRDSFQMSSFEFGVSAGIYLLGFSFSSPFFSHYSDRFPPLLMMTAGMVVWATMCICIGLSLGFGSLVVVRTLTGVGEASFLCFAPPFIDAFAPRNRRSVWLATFYTMIPVGFAAGVMLSGQWIDGHPLGVDWTWRVPFILEGLLVIPIICVLCLIPGPRNMGELSQSRTSTIAVDLSEDGIISEAHHMSVKEKLKFLRGNLIYIAVVAAYTSQTFVIGAFAVELPTYFQKVYGYSEGYSTAIFGVIALTAGIIGSAGGGAVLDYMRDSADKVDGVPLAALQMALLSALAFPAALVGFAIPVPGIAFPAMFIVEISIFGQYAPANNAILWVTPTELQPFAISITTICVHAFGDALSPAILGFVLDQTNQNWKFTMLLGSMFLILPIICSIVAWRLSLRIATNKSNEARIWGRWSQTQKLLPDTSASFENGTTNVTNGEIRRTRSRSVGSLHSPRSEI